jgi:hypothetical protein
MARSSRGYLREAVGLKEEWERIYRTTKAKNRRSYLRKATIGLKNGQKHVRI